MHVDFDRHVIIVRDGKGNKDRVAMLPQTLKAAFRSQMAQSSARCKNCRATRMSAPP